MFKGSTALRLIEVDHAVHSALGASYCCMPAGPCGSCVLNVTTCYCSVFFLQLRTERKRRKAEAEAAAAQEARARGRGGAAAAGVGAGG
jgi:hypothetical protein